MKFSNFSRTTSRSHSITGIISIPNKGCYATLREKKNHKYSKSSPVTYLPPFHLFSATQVTNYCQVNLRNSANVKQNILLWYQYLDNT